MYINCVEIQNAMMHCTGRKLPGVDDLLDKLYYYMPNLFGDLLADIYCNRQQNIIPSSVSQGEVALLKKDPNNGEPSKNV